MKKICIAIFYFGRWPKWFSIYLETCRYNPTINWLFFTDCGKPENAPDNAAFIEGSLEDFNKLATKKIGFKINIKNYYKVCDFKPAFGVIFEDYLKGYDFWGCGDIDVIYGDIRKFIIDDVLKNYDVINARREYIVAHFILFKNSHIINRLYERGIYKKVFRSSRYYNFDESNFIFNKPISNERFKKESLTHIVKHLAHNGSIRFFARTICRGDFKEVTRNFFGKWHLALDEGLKLYWNRGKLIDARNNEEILYFHFQKLKTSNKFSIPEWASNTREFFITPEGFVKD